MLFGSADYMKYKDGFVGTIRITNEPNIALNGLKVNAILKKKLDLIVPPLEGGTVNGVYETEYPFIPGSTMIFINGIRMKLGDDYIEISDHEIQFLNEIYYDLDDYNVVVDLKAE